MLCAHQSPYTGRTHRHLPHQKNKRRFWGSNLRHHRLAGLPVKMLVSRARRSRRAEGRTRRPPLRAPRTPGPRDYQDVIPLRQSTIRFKLLFPVSVSFSCCSPLTSASVPDFNSSLIASALAAPPPRLRPIQLLLLDCVHFNCSSPIASASTAAPRLHPLVA